MSPSAFNSGFSRTSRHTTSSLVAQLSPNTHPANLPTFGHLEQTLLNGNANVATRTSRSVTVHDFEKGMALLSRDGNLTFEPLQRLGNRRPIRLEVYRFDGV